MVGSGPPELAERISGLLEDRKKLEREVSELRKKLATGGAAAEVEEIAGLPDPVGNVMAKWDRPNGLQIERVRMFGHVLRPFFVGHGNTSAGSTNGAGRRCVSGSPR